jgi:CheY-like chemotaxis protein
MHRPPSLHPVSPAAHTLRILAVDDDQVIRDVVRAALTREGHQVTTVDDGSRAHQLVEENPGAFDLVITDHQMPVMTGLELVACLRGMTYPGRIIVLSGSLDRELLAGYRALGVDDLLDKPVTLETLRTAVGRMAAATA